MVFKIVYAFTDGRFHRVRLSPKIEMELAQWDKYATNSHIILRLLYGYYVSIGSRKRIQRGYAVAQWQLFQCGMLI